jgi:hypothetical protein
LSKQRQSGSRSRQQLPSSRDGQHAAPEECQTVQFERFPFSIRTRNKTVDTGIPFELHRQQHKSFGNFLHALRLAILATTSKYHIVGFDLELEMAFNGEPMAVDESSWPTYFKAFFADEKQRYSMKGYCLLCIAPHCGLQQLSLLWSLKISLLLRLRHSNNRALRCLLCLQVHNERKLLRLILFLVMAVLALVQALAPSRSRSCLSSPQRRLLSASGKASLIIYRTHSKRLSTTPTRLCANTVRKSMLTAKEVVGF